MEFLPWRVNYWAWVRFCARHWEWRCEEDQEPRPPWSRQARRASSARTSWSPFRKRASPLGWFQIPNHFCMIVFGSFNISTLLWNHIDKRFFFPHNYHANLFYSLFSAYSWRMLDFFLVLPFEILLHSVYRENISEFAPLLCQALCKELRDYSEADIIYVPGYNLLGERERHIHKQPESMWQELTQKQEQWSAGLSRERLPRLSGWYWNPSKFFVFTTLLCSSSLCYNLIYFAKGSFKYSKW